jgi:hypothetical protein
MTKGLVSGIKVLGNYAHVADGSNGLLIFDITNPSSPIVQESCPVAVDSWGISVSGDYVYVADHNNGLVILKTYKDS